LTQLDYKIFGLETIKDQYVHDTDFKDVLLHCQDGKTWNKFVFNDGFVFQANKLCIPASSICLLLLQEAHGGGLMGGTLWCHEDGGHSCCSFLLAEDEKRCGALCCSLHYMSKG
jgi:hypothetical protein